VGAALLFMVQPMVGRAVLPRLGGAPLVWVVCLAFFQLGLFLGYLLVHLSTAWLSAARQRLLQLTLAGLALAMGPLHLGRRLPAGPSPALSLLAFLAVGVGLAYLTLATTAPLLQLDYARRTGRRPYHLYAISNAGSLLGLLAYPFVVEPSLSLGDQARLWRLGFAVYAGLIGLIALTGRAPGTVAADALEAADPAQAQPGDDAPSPGRSSWFFLSAAPAALLGALSNHITVDVAASPLLWVVALALYLVSFMVAFAGERFHLPELHRGLWIACSVALPVMLLPGNQVPLPMMLGIPLLTLWTGAVLCHGELALRSPHGGRLTAYYVWLSAGGAAGGGFVAFVAPMIFDGHYELPLAVLATHAALAAASRRRDPRQPPSGAQRLTWLGTGLAVPVLLAVLYAQVQGLGQPGEVLERTRNFFGPLEVSQTGKSTILTHGRTHHGKQLRDPALRHQPVAYFGPDSGAGRVLRLHARGRAREIGVIGLGVGTLAAYTRPGDRIRFYEINPEITRLARAHFTYLQQAAGQVQVLHGDGRMLVAAEPPGRYDVLLLDAFSSDSVPTHLLTVEAFALYLRALASDGVLVANVSNRHLAVHRAVVGAARAHALHAVVIESPGDPERGLSRARWALMARDVATLRPMLREPVRRLPVAHPVAFTDRRSSLWSIVD
jgi:protein-L-isoaspartate O-methyltransferase